MSTKTVVDLREALFKTLQDLQDGKVEIERAKAVSDVAQTIINSAKVEIEYLRLSDGGQSGFLEPPKELPNGITSITQHRLRG